LRPHREALCRAPWAPAAQRQIAANTLYSRMGAADIAAGGQCGEKAHGGASRRRPALLLRLLLFCGLLHSACAELSVSGDSSLTTWLRRAAAPSASQRSSNRPVPTSVVCAMWTGAEEVARQVEQGWVQRAFAPSGKTSEQGSFETRATARCRAAQKLSRVTIDQAAGEEELTALEPAPAKRQLMAMRGGGVEHAFHHSSSAGKTGVGGSRERKAGAGGRARSFAQGYGRGLAFMHGDSSIIGSPGCSRDWTQLVQSTAPALHPEGGRESACRRSSRRIGRFSLQRSPSPGRDRPYRLSRTVEDAELPASLRSAHH
jgi:hypothetical protein